MILQSPTRFLELRNLDPTGNGWYGASRGSREHLGLDVVTFPGEEIFACMGGKVSKLGWMYHGYTAGMRYIEITNKVGNHEYRLRQCYVAPKIKKGVIIEANQFIGVAENVSDYHFSKGDKHRMKNHIHLQLWKNGLITDPEPLFKELQKC